MGVQMVEICVLYRDEGSPAAKSRTGPMLWHLSFPSCLRKGTWSFLLRNQVGVALDKSL